MSAADACWKGLDKSLKNITILGFSTEFIRLASFVCCIVVLRRLQHYFSYFMVTVHIYSWSLGKQTRTKPHDNPSWLSCCHCGSNLRDASFQLSDANQSTTGPKLKLRLFALYRPTQKNPYNPKLILLQKCWRFFLFCSIVFHFVWWEGMKDKHGCVDLSINNSLKYCY